MRRVSVVGSPGSGKTTLAGELSSRLGLPHIELDAMYHRPGWVPTPRDEFRAALRELMARHPGWVIDGNYRSLVQDLIWERADTVVWLDPPRASVMAAVVRRTLSRIFLQRELWNGNYERFRSLFDRRPEENLILWTWTRFRVYRERYASAMTDEANGDLEFVHLRSRRRVREWLRTLA